MVAGQQPAAAGKAILCCVLENQLAAPLDLAGAHQMSYDAVEGDPAQADDHAQPREQSDFFVEKRSARSQFFGKGLISRGRAADHRRDPCVFELEAVPAMGRSGLRSKPGTVQQGIEEISGAVPGKRPPGAIRAMRSGSEPDNQYACLWIAERGYRLSPVLKVNPRTPPLRCNCRAMCAQPLAPAARNHALVEQKQRRIGSRLGNRHPAIVESRPAGTRGVEWVRFRIRSRVFIMPGRQKPCRFDAEWPPRPSLPQVLH